MSGSDIYPESQVDRVFLDIFKVKDYEKNKVLLEGIIGEN
jgi:hypothetical protein